MKRAIYFLLVLAGITLAPISIGWAEEEKASPSVGEKIGSAGRQVADDSKKAYQGTKEETVKIYREVVQDFKKAVQEAKAAGTQTMEDVKRGYKKEPAAKNTAPSSTEREAVPATPPKAKE